MINNATIEDIRSKVDIVEVINSYITLEKKGKNYFGICPFHDDHAPSMSVSPSLQIYMCFTCKAGGNVFKFISDFENISYNDAVIKVANMINYPLNIKNLPNSIKQVKNSEIYEAYDLANKFFINTIHTKIASEALDYLHNRSISDETIKNFEIGLASMINPVSNFLLAKGYTKSQLEEYGIISESSNEIFNNRIMIPIHNHTGAIIAWTGRIYNNSQTNKYLNSKETTIFKKGDILFNYHRANTTIKKKDFVIIVEGNMDVIRLVNNGITNCVALMGTSLSKEQTSLIKRLTNNIVLCLDNDNPGNLATKTIAQELTNNGFNVKIVLLNDTKDPDEYIIKNGVESFNNIVYNAISFFDYKLNNLKNKRNFSNMEEISSYIKEVMVEVNKSDDNLLKEMTINKLSKDYNISVSSLISMLEKKESINTINIPKTNKDNKYDKASKRIIKMMLISAEAIIIANEQAIMFKEERYKFLYEEILYYYKKNGIINIADFCNYLYNKEEVGSLLFEILNEYDEYQYNEEELLDYINLLNNMLLLEKKKQLKIALAKELDPIKKANLVKEMIKLGDK